MIFKYMQIIKSTKIKLNQVNQIKLGYHIIKD